MTPLKGSTSRLLGWLKTRRNIKRKASKQHRRLEIGPDEKRIDGFETLNVLNLPNVDYVWNAIEPLPFPNNVFDLIYSSHTLEHIPWFLVESVLADWVSKLRPGGSLEIWVPDGLKIASAFVEAEIVKSTEWTDDGWFRFNEKKDPCKWASGRLFTYGDGTANVGHPNWHRAVFSERYLSKLFEEAGLVNIERMPNSRVRGYDHGWINLGVSALKPCYSLE